MAIQRIEFLVEDRSTREALKVLVPKIVPGVPYEVLAFNGKHDLLRNLPNRLRGYRYWVRSADTGLVLLIDRDAEDCLQLREKLNVLVQREGFIPGSVSDGAPGTVMNRIAIEELEAWFFGDVAALARAYPGVPATLAKRARYRDPDAITGGTAEALGRVLKRAGHHRGGLEKVRAAAAIAAHMNVEDNRSRSFQKFRDGVRLLVRGGADAQA